MAGGFPKVNDMREHFNDELQPLNEEEFDPISPIQRKSSVKEPAPKSSRSKKSSKSPPKKRAAA
jgi:hypothetical protein